MFSKMPKKFSKRKQKADFGKPEQENRSAENAENHSAEKAEKTEKREGAEKRQKKASHKSEIMRDYLRSGRRFHP